VKLRKGATRGRVKSDLPIEFTEEPLTAHAGLELLRRFLDRSGFVKKLDDVFADRQFECDYGPPRMALIARETGLRAGSSSAARARSIST
jgi:hypothetical protein